MPYHFLDKSDKTALNPQQEQTSAPFSALPAHLFRSDKTYGHEAGLSCCFRQWRAKHSHCRLLHGYALSFSFTFIAQNLDKHGWVMDFGGLQPIKSWLYEKFDHKIIVAEDDPQLQDLLNMAQKGLCSLTILPHVGCEAFAYYVWRHSDALIQHLTSGRARAEAVAVREHGGNGAVFKAESLFDSP